MLSTSTMHTPGRRGLPASDDEEPPSSITKTASDTTIFGGATEKKEKTRTEIRIKNIYEKGELIVKIWSRRGRRGLIVGFKLF